MKDFFWKSFFLGNLFLEIFFWKVFFLEIFFENFFWKFFFLVFYWWKNYDEISESCLIGIIVSMKNKSGYFLKNNCMMIIKVAYTLKSFYILSKSEKKKIALGRDRTRVLLHCSLLPYPLRHNDEMKILPKKKEFC